jgi:hypothetical protein
MSFREVEDQFKHAGATPSDEQMIQPFKPQVGRLVGTADGLDTWIGEHGLTSVVEAHRLECWRNCCCMMRRSG